MSEESELYEMTLKTVGKILSLSGCYFDEADANINVMKRFINRRLYCFNVVMLTTHLIGDLAWLAYEYKSAGLIKLTYFIPCVILSLLACVKSYQLIKNGDRVTDLIKSTKNLQVISARSGLRMETERELKKRVMFLNGYINFVVILYVVGLIMYAVGPLILTWMLYNSSGKLMMQLPFLSKYPFDDTDIRYWPMAYVHQIWAGVIDASAVHGSDSFYALSCNFLQIQFTILQYDIERVIPNDFNTRRPDAYAEFRKRFVPLIKRHKELIRCVNIIETIYSKSNFFNLAVSSVVICVSAFNITTLDGIHWKIVFVFFATVWLLQVYSLCYYGNLINLSSTEISDGIYNSLWYKTDARIMKEIRFMLTRAQKPCNLTAWGFSDLNLRTFNKVVSTSWSYFALLQTMNNDY